MCVYGATVLNALERMTEDRQTDRPTDRKKERKNTERNEKRLRKDMGEVDQNNEKKK